MIACFQWKLYQAVVYVFGFEAMYKNLTLPASLVLVHSNMYKFFDKFHVLVFQDERVNEYFIIRTRVENIFKLKCV